MGCSHYLGLSLGRCSPGLQLLLGFADLTQKFPPDCAVFMQPHAQRMISELEAQPPKNGCWANGEVLHLQMGKVGFDADNWKIQLENIQRKKYELR